MTATPDANMLREKILDGYTKIANDGQWSGVQAETGGSCCGGGGCCGPTTLTAEQVAQAVGYGEQDIAALPTGANMGLSCGNPTAIAALQPGEVAVDLGSGGGMDCFLAGPRVGPTGRVIGVDMTPDMLGKARRNIESYQRQSGLDNVEFRLGEIENLPLGDGSVDVVLSNCVINLSPDKRRVWQEVFRVLKSGGRVAISDLALLKPLPASVLADLEALVGCVAGADLVKDVQADMEAAGLIGIELTPKPEYVKAMSEWQDPLYNKIIEALPDDSSIADYVTSLDIAAHKP